MPEAHVIPGFKGKIHDPIALAREQFQGKTASQQKEVLEASRILATVRELASRVKALEAKVEEQDKLINAVLTK
jgi:hypothetical protein